MKKDAGQAGMTDSVITVFCCRSNSGIGLSKILERFSQLKIAVLGIGNILLSDEGIGVRVVEAIKDRYELPESVEIIDGGTMGLDLLPFIEGKDKVLIIDAVNIEKPPGTMVTIEGDEIPKFLSMKMSVHQIGLPDMLSAAKLMGIMPEEIYLIGIQPKNLGTGLLLSDDVGDNLDSLVQTAMNKLEEWGIMAKEKKPV